LLDGTYFYGENFDEIRVENLAEGPFKVRGPKPDHSYYSGVSVAKGTFDEGQGKTWHWEYMEGGERIKVPGPEPAERFTETTPMTVDATERLNALRLTKGESSGFTAMRDRQKAVIWHRDGEREYYWERQGRQGIPRKVYRDLSPNVGEIVNSLPTSPPI